MGATKTIVNIVCTDWKFQFLKEYIRVSVFRMSIKEQLFRSSVAIYQLRYCSILDLPRWSSDHPLNIYCTIFMDRWWPYKKRSILITFYWGFTTFSHDLAQHFLSGWLTKLPGGTPRKIDGGVRPASQTSYPICDQKMRFVLPYLWPNQKCDTLYMSWPSNQYPVLHLPCN